jgi:hypothetical protein
MNSLPITCVALIGPTGNLLYLQSALDSVDFTFLSHGACDLFNERPKASSNYLGHLATMQGYNLYGYITATNLKLLIFMPTTDVATNNEDVMTAFRAIHSYYIALLNNPFYTICTPIKSTHFKQSLDKMLSTYVSPHDH